MSDALLEIFAQEAEEIIEALEKGLLDLEGGENPDQINLVFRAAHTMKGNAGLMGYEDVVELTHLMESILDEMRNGAREPDSHSVGVLLSSVDSLKVLVDQRMAGMEPPPPEEVLEALRMLQGDGTRETDDDSYGQPADGLDDTPGRFHIIMRLEPDIFSTGTDPLQFLLELGELGHIDKVVCHDEELPPFAEVVGDRLYLWWELWLDTVETLETVRQVFLFVEDENNIIVEPDNARQGVRDPEATAPPVAPEPESEPVTAEPPPPIAPPPAPKMLTKEAPVPKKKPPVKKSLVREQASSTVRVDTEKLDKLVNLVGELVIGAARVNQLKGEGDTELASAVETLDHISHDLQEQVMRVRMFPVEATFKRFQRMVRDLSTELKKKISLQLSGIETELDKNVIEQIADPLKHLVRNSVDHGLEGPEERLAAGKDETGTIWLRALQQGGKIFIEVADDGRGIDRDKIWAKAVERGLASEGESVSDAEVFSYMFEPGFSTAEKVTAVSGRGVGLDVVRQNIESLRGVVEVESKLGEGTTFRIKLPLTLAIIDSMTVKVGDEVLTLPILSIVESLRPKAKDIHTMEGKHEMLSVRGEYLPLVRLYEVLRLPTKHTDITEALVVIIDGVGKRFGLMVDDIVDEQQAVIKSLEQNYKRVEGLAGATILGDGRVSLILDFHGLEKMAFA